MQALDARGRADASLLLDLMSFAHLLMISLHYLQLINPCLFLLDQQIPTMTLIAAIDWWL